MADLATTVRAFMAKHAPSREEVQNSPLLKPFGQRIRNSELWRFTRRSVPRGVAIGLFVGIFLMVPGLQIVGAALVCMALRGNVAIAAAMTFLSNPATTPFFLVAAVNVGNRLGFHADLTTLKVLSSTHASIGRWFDWLVSDAAPAMVMGLVVIAALFAFAGYWVSLVGWRWWVGRKWLHRRALAREGAPAE
ncbi:DUF2062 domain-containing protein [Sphingomonas sp. SM33]|uniref:DUF2062 domain-containing protein n=1 Tax=Sphingomonas telluris TaxID=2907998 RepID=A0ABS9VKV4_9SPHN|nr:DUF2062 domain-containing protein [Sphingomonas telluris]